MALKCVKDVDAFTIPNLGGLASGFKFMLVNGKVGKFIFWNLSKG